MRLKEAQKSKSFTLRSPVSVMQFCQAKHKGFALCNTI